MSSLRQTLAGALVGTALLGGALAAQAAPGQTCYFGECGGGAKPATPAAGSGWNDGSESSSWTVYKSQDGAVLVVDSFSDGGTLALVIKDGKVGLVLFDPSWNLQAGEKYAISIDIDGTVYSGTARATDDGRMVVVGDLSRDFLRAFIRGNAGVITVAGIRFDVSLTGAARVIDIAAGRG